MHGTNNDRTTFEPSNGDAPERLARTATNLSDRLQASLLRLEATGAFDQRQMRLIEVEFHSLCKSNESFSQLPTLKPGDQVGRFVIDEMLGWGGEAYVFRAHESETGKPTAIKVLHNARTSDRFHREMKMVQQLAHPNIVTAYEVAEINGMPFIAMELMSGPDLNALVREEGPIGWQESSQYILQIARALAHAHCRDLVHRDIKPGNIILNGEDQVKLVDLGLASMRMNFDDDDEDDETHSLHLTGDAQIAGTLPFMAPEQAQSLSKADKRSDIFSLGATWFFLLTGKTRVRGKTFCQQYNNLISTRRFRGLPDDCMPQGLVNVFEKMVVYDRRKRYQDCSTLANKLGQALVELGQFVISKQLSVLVVEDSQTDMILAVEFLRMANDSLVIYQATTLAEGIKIHGEKSVDLVFLDLTLPDSAGVRTVEAFHEQATNVPIVVLTGMSDDATALACVQAGATEFISKMNLTAHKLERVIFVTLSRFSAS